ncbi:MAG: hypothetical protein ACYC2T_13850 [Bacillota bacterium]
MSPEKIKVGIGFVTGRKNFEKLVRTYVCNWEEHGLVQNSKISLNLFVAYDLKYFGTKVSDYQIKDDTIHKAIDSYYLFSITTVAEEIRNLTENGVLTDREARLLFGEGYGKLRNLVTYFALKRGIDYLIFIDDDEYPIAVVRTKENRLSWVGQDVVATHLRHIGGSDLTHGYHCGYISPIPNMEFSGEFTEDVFRMFIEAISNDIINWDSFTEKMKDGGITYADINLLNKLLTSEVPEISGCKFISGSNLCLNLKNIEKIAPFYNPPGARGEDTFLSTCLSRLKVVKVPIYTFHDGFLNYTHLLNGVLPYRLKPSLASSAHVADRFLKASVGWVRYKPLFLYITRRKEYEAEITRMRECLKYSIPRLSKYFRTDQFTGILHEFEYYNAKVALHFQEFEESKEAWKKLIAFTRVCNAEQAV